MENYFAQPFDVAIVPDLSKVFVSGSGADEVAILDGRKLLAAATSQGAERLAGDLTEPAVCSGADSGGTQSSRNGALARRQTAGTSPIAWMTQSQALTQFAAW